MVEVVAPKALVLFSNPTGTERLRLDKEHRALASILRERSLPQDAVHRLHAVNLNDIRAALQANDYDIIQFSGHGSPDGIIIDDEAGSTSLPLSAAQLAALLRTARREPRVLLLLSCFSSNTVGEIGTCAPYTITVQGTSDDDACIEYSAAFHAYYFMTNSVETTFCMCNDWLEAKGLDDTLTTVLLRRGLNENRDQVYFSVCSARESALIDLAEVEPVLGNLDMTREQFLSLLCRKIWAHRSYFDYPQEKGILPVGRYICEVKWTRREDPFILKGIYLIRPDAPLRGCEAFAGLLVSYNDMVLERYRSAERPASPEMEKGLQYALQARDRVTRHLETFEPAILEVAPSAFRTSAPLFKAYTDQAAFKLAAGDLASAVSYLEVSLTALHDLVEALMTAVTERVGAALSGGLP